MDANAFLRLVGSNVRRLRATAGLTQEHVAYEAKIDRTYLSDIERGRRNPSLKVLCRLAAVIGVHPILLIVEENQEEAVRQALSTE